MIRKIAKADTDAVLALMKDLAIYHNQLEFVKIDRERFVENAFCPQPSFEVFVAEVEGRLVGYVSFTRNFSIWAGNAFISIDDVYVKPEVRSLGVGKKLMTRMKQEAEKDGASHLKWEVEEDNHKAIRFYRGLGASPRIKGVVTWRI